MGADCILKGWVLDGFPSTPSQATAMSKAGVIPHIVLSLTLSPEDAMLRGRLDAAAVAAAKDASTEGEDPTSMPSSEGDIPALWARVQAAAPHCDAVNRHFTGMYESVRFIDATQSKWNVSDEVVRLVKKSIRARRKYWQAIHELRAGAIWPMCFTPQRFFEQRSPLLDFCPVSLSLHGRLIDCGRTHEYAAEYNGLLYKCAGPVELARFVVQPSLYLNGTKLPAKLPRRVALNIAHHLLDSDIEKEAQCPVTLTDKGGKVVPGMRAKCVEYDGKIYSMADESSLVKFMQVPWVYSKAALPAYKPAKEAPIPTNSLPDWGFLDQSVAASLTAAMTSLSSYKHYLCYPGMTVRESALKFLAIHLKAHNKLSTDLRRAKYAERLLEFDECCSMRDVISHEYNTTPLPKTNHRSDDFELLVAKYDNVSQLDVKRFIR